MSPVLDKESVDLKVLAYKIKENLIQKYFASLQYRTEDGKSTVQTVHINEELQYKQLLPTPSCTIIASAEDYKNCTDK